MAYSSNIPRYSPNVLNLTAAVSFSGQQSETIYLLLRRGNGIQEYGNM